MIGSHNATVDIWCEGSAELLVEDGLWGDCWGSQCVQFPLKIQNVPSFAETCVTHALSVMMFARLSHFYLFILLPINYKPACVCLIMHQCVHQTSFRTQSSQGRLCVVGHKQEVAACGFISYSALTCGWVLTPQVVPLRQRNALVAQPDSAHGRQTRRGFR